MDIKKTRFYEPQEGPTRGSPAVVFQDGKTPAPAITHFNDEKEFEIAVWKKNLADFLRASPLPNSGVLNFSDVFSPHLSVIEDFVKDMPKGQRPFVLILPKKAQPKFLANLSAFIETAQKRDPAPDAKLEPKPISETTKKDFRQLAALFDANAPFPFPVIWILGVSDRNDPIACTVFPTSAWLQTKGDLSSTEVLKKVQSVSADLSWSDWTIELPKRMTTFVADTTPEPPAGGLRMGQMVGHLARRFSQVNQYFKNPFYAPLKTHSEYQSLTKEMQDLEKMRPLFMAFERFQSIESHLTAVEEQIDERAFLISAARPFLEKEKTKQPTELFLNLLLADPARNRNDGIFTEWNQFKSELEKN